MENAKRSGENYSGRGLIFIRTRRVNFLVATDFKNSDGKDSFYFVITEMRTFGRCVVLLSLLHLSRNMDMNL